MQTSQFVSLAEQNNFGQLSKIAVFQSQNVSNGQVRLTGVVTPNEASMESWLIASWKSLSNSAYADYLRNHDRLRERRSILAREVANFDGRTSRRVEREQIMRAVLEWLFPGFNDSSSARRRVDRLNFHWG